MMQVSLDTSRGDATPAPPRGVNIWPERLPRTPLRSDAQRSCGRTTARPRDHLARGRCHLADFVVRFEGDALVEIANGQALRGGGHLGDTASNAARSPRALGPSTACWRHVVARA